MNTCTDIDLIYSYISYLTFLIILNKDFFIHKTYTLYFYLILWVFIKHHFHQYFSYIVAVGFLSGGNRVSGENDQSAMGDIMLYQVSLMFYQDNKMSVLHRQF